MNKLTKIAMAVAVSGVALIGVTAPSMAVTPPPMNDAVVVPTTTNAPAPVTPTTPTAAKYTVPIGHCGVSIGDCNGGLAAPAPIKNDSNDPGLFGSNNSNDPGLFGKVPVTAPTHWGGLTSTIGTTAPNHLNDFQLVLA